MASKHSRRRVERRARFESLEDRQMFSADPSGGAIVEHLLSAPDFWYDTALDQDLDARLGDVEQTLASANALTGLTKAFNDYGFDGAGQTVAVIDSGIAWDHPNLGGGFGTGARVVGGWDFTEANDANPYDDGPAGSHGTHVAGIVGATANSVGDVGVAPGVDLVALRVFNDQGAGYFSWVEKALQWVHTNRNAFANPITAVNLSLGTAYNAATVPRWAMLEDEFAQLKADGIFIAVSAGNSFTTYNAPGLSYPAASSSVVPVMSVDDSGSLSYFSQRLSRAIAAPGRSIRSTVPDYVGNQNGVTDDWANYSGTSMASPYVAGASVLVREAMEFVGYTNLMENTIYNHMMSTADQIYDAATSQFYKRLNVSAALDALMPDDEFGSTAETAYGLGTVNGAQSISGLIGTLSDKDFFTFTAGASGTLNLTVSGTHYLMPHVTLVGGTATFEDGTWSFDVVAGQSYTMSLETAAAHGIGYYTANLTLEESSVPIPMTVKSIVRYDGVVFALDSDGWLSYNGNRVWQNTYDFAVSPADGTLYWQSTSGLFQHRLPSGSWNTLDFDAVEFAVSDAGKAYSLGVDGWLNVDGIRVWSNTRDFELTADQTLYWQSNTGLLQRRPLNGVWKTVDRTSTRFAVRDNGMFYSLGADNVMSVNGTKVWASTQDFVLSASESLYWLSTKGLLQRQLADRSWQNLDVHVKEFAICNDGVVYTLTNDSNVKVDGVRTWSDIVDMRTDATGCLLVESTSGTVQRIVGRFQVSRQPAVEADSVEGQFVQSSAGGVHAQFAAMSSVERAYESVGATLSVGAEFRRAVPAVSRLDTLTEGHVNQVVSLPTDVVCATFRRDDLFTESGADLVMHRPDSTSTDRFDENDLEAFAVKEAIDTVFETIGGSA